MVRLIDIAQKTGFSVAVVSRALQQEKDPYDRISEKSRALIRETAREMGYTRNLQAALLRRGRMPAVRVLLPAWESPEVMQLAKGISDASLELGYPLLIHYYRKDADYITFLQRCCQEKNTGVLFYLHDKMNRNDLRNGCEAYLNGGGKMIFMNARSADFTDIVPDMVTLNIDEEYGGRLAGEYLKERHCREYSVVYASSDRYTLLRCKGFSDSLGGEKNVRCCLDFLRIGENYPQYMARSRRLLDHFYENAIKGNSMPHGIFFTSFFMANTVMCDLMRRGLKEDEHIHAVGFSSNVDLHYPLYYYAKIVIPFYEIGNIAMKKLVHMLNGKKESSQMFRPSVVYDYDI